MNDGLTLDQFFCLGPLSLSALSDPNKKTVAGEIPVVTPVTVISIFRTGEVIS
jgi:hypothetical protein